MSYEFRLHDGFTMTTPAEAGYDAEMIHRLDELYSSYIKQGSIQCAGYLMSRKGGIFAHKTMGSLRYYGITESFLPDSIRRIASITKPVTAIAVMQLVEKGLLRLEQNAAVFIEEFRKGPYQNISVHQLLTHTSGIYPEPGYLSEAYKREIIGAAPSENWIIDSLKGPMLYIPGEAWSYSSAGYCILGEIITRVTGIYAEDYIAENIIRPLGMANTYFTVPEELRSSVCLATEEDKEIFERVHDRRSYPPRTGGGLYSTLADVWKLGQMMLNKGFFNSQRVLSRKSTELMTRNQLTGVKAYYWGMNLTDFPMGIGWQLRPKGELVSPGTFFHEGVSRCGLYVDPAEEFIAVFMVPAAKGNKDSMVNPLAMMWSGLL